MKAFKLYKHKIRSPFGRLAYEIIRKGLLLRFDSIVVCGVTFGMLDKIVKGVLNDTPKLFYVKDFKFYMWMGICIVKPRYLKTKDEIKSILSTLNERVEALCIPMMDASEYDKVLFVHDWICRKVKYRDVGLDSHSAVGPLLYGEGVCEGIAMATKLLLDRMGVDCCVVKGEARSNEYSGDIESHGWNKVKVNGKWFNLDVTFDCTIGSPYSIRYDYFLTSDHSIQKTHCELEYSGLKCDEDAI